MKTVISISFLLITFFSAEAQMRRDRMGNPVVGRTPNKQEIAKYKEKIEARKDQYIANFISTLDADEFKKEIIKQHLNSYYVEKKKLYNMNFDTVFERDQAVKQLNKSHFKELETLISEKNIQKIIGLINGDFDEKKAKKDKKRKRKKKEKN